MRVSRYDIRVANVAYQHRELSSQVARDGVTAGVLRLETDDGLVGWGEFCAGSDIASVVDAARAVGVPEITPVPAFSARPAGRAGLMV